MGDRNIVCISEGAKSGGVAPLCEVLLPLQIYGTVVTSLHTSHHSTIDRNRNNLQFLHDIQDSKSIHSIFLFFYFLVINVMLHRGGFSSTNYNLDDENS